MRLQTLKRGDQRPEVKRWIKVRPWLGFNMHLVKGRLHNSFRLPYKMTTNLMTLSMKAFENEDKKRRENVAPVLNH